LNQTFFERKTMKNVFVVLLVLVAATGFGAIKSLKSAVPSQAASQTATNTYADSQVDTVKLSRVAGLSALAFGVAIGDSVSITDVIVRRVIGGGTTAVAAGDTLYSSYATTAAGKKLAAVTLAPVAEEYWFIVTYAGSANGVTSPTVTYTAVQQLDR
jgi:uncharacterized membrane protein